MCQDVTNRLLCNFKTVSTIWIVTNAHVFVYFQGYNATQLSSWCLFFISSNYLSFEKRSEFPQLKGDNRVHVEENRWPPVTYLKEVEAYEKKHGSKSSNESCVVMWPAWLCSDRVVEDYASLIKHSCSAAHSRWRMIKENMTTTGRCTFHDGNISKVQYTLDKMCALGLSPNMYPNLCCRLHVTDINGLHC